VLDRTVAKGNWSGNVRPPWASFDKKRTELTSWHGSGPRVGPTVPAGNGDGLTVLPGNGQTYDSLSKVAFAITGTKWNGPPLLWPPG